MRVCLISGSYPPMRDGVGDYTQKFFFELVRQVGEPNAVLVTTRVADRQEGGPQPVYAVPRWSLRHMPWIIREVERARPDVVNLQYPTEGYVRYVGASLLPWLLRLRFPKTPLVATLHEFTSRTFKGRCRLLVSLYPCVRILSVNPQDRAALQGMAPRLVPRLRHLPVGATLFPYRLPRSEADAFRRDQGWERRFPILTYFGVLRPTKGIEELVVAFGIVRRKFPDALLLLLGHADEEFLNGRLLPMLDQEGVRDAVYLAGRCTEDTLSRYLAVTDLCALPYPDGLSPRRTSFMAALQAEQAIVTTTPLFPFAEIRDNENVLLVPVGVPGALAEGIVRVAVDAALCGRLRRGAAGLKAVFRWDRIVAEALAVFEEAVALASCRATMGSKA